MLYNISIIGLEIMLMTLICNGKEKFKQRKQLQLYGLAMITLNLCIILPLSAMNSALDIQVSKGAGLVHKYPKLKRIRDHMGIYLMQAIVYSTALVLILVSIIVVAFGFTWILFLSEDQSDQSMFLNIVEDAQFYVVALLPAAYFHCINDIYIRFLISHGFLWWACGVESLIVLGLIILGVSQGET